MTHHFFFFLSFCQSPTQQQHKYNTCVQMLDHVERQSFPLEELLPKLSRVCPAGSFLKGHGCPGQSLMAVSMAAMEMARVDASIATLFMVHSAIGMAAIGLCGSEEQKARYLPAMARYESISAFALTEPDVGSDASHLRTTATPTADRRGWVISGKKRWIGNASHSGAIVVWAMNTESGKVNGFIVERGTPGMTIEVIKNKIALRSVQNANITFQECVVDDAQRLPLAEDFRSGPGRVLFISRLFAAWLPVGIAAGCYDTALEYAKTRQQFGSPIARFQLVQAKLVKMLSHIQSMTYTAWRVTRLMEQGKCTHGMSSMVKANNTTLAREVAGMAREILGGNGIVRDYGVATHFCDLEGLQAHAVFPFCLFLSFPVD